MLTNVSAVQRRRGRTSAIANRRSAVPRRAARCRPTPRPAGRAPSPGVVELAPANDVAVIAPVSSRAPKAVTHRPVTMSLAVPRTRWVKVAAAVRCTVTVNPAGEARLVAEGVPLLPPCWPIRREHLLDDGAAAVDGHHVAADPESGAGESSCGRPPWVRSRPRHLLHCPVCRDGGWPPSPCSAGCPVGSGTLPASPNSA